jgi:cytidylate kinase
VSLIVTISGDSGSGKTSVARMLSSKLALDHVSVGQLHREIAQELGLNTLELNLHAESEPKIDERLELVLRSLLTDGRDYVIESRTAWSNFKGSLNVYLKVDSDVGAKRVMADINRDNEPIYISHEHAKAQLRVRKDSENRRYLAEYGIDCGDLRNYDVLIDTTVLAVDQIVDGLVPIIRGWRETSTDDAPNV